MTDHTDELLHQRCELRTHHLLGAQTLEQTLGELPSPLFYTQNVTLLNPRNLLAFPRTML